MASDLEYDLRDTVDWGRKWFVDFNAGKTQLVSFDQSKNIGAIDMKMDESVLEKNSSFKMLGWLFLLNWIGALTLSLLVKLPPRYLELWFVVLLFVLTPEVAQYFYKSTIRPCMTYCCHLWAGTSSCHLEFLDKLQKWICRTIGFSFAASLKPFDHRRNVASLSFFYSYNFRRCSSELANWLHFLFLKGGLFYCMIFLSPFLDVTSMSMSAVSFLS